MVNIWRVLYNNTIACQIIFFIMYFYKLILIFDPLKSQISLVSLCGTRLSYRPIQRSVQPPF
jgi:hypothetical protein